MHVIDLKLTDFREAYDIQLDLVNRVSLGISEDTLLITEHRGVVTMGRRGSWANIFKSREELSSRGIDILNIDRGGDVTYHGPGQIIAYPIFKLEGEGRDIHRFLDLLEAVGIHFLSQYGLMAERGPGLRGVWIDGKKICSIGIGVRKWVTYHGIAINVNVDLEPFSFIRACGIEGAIQTSLKDILRREVDLSDAKDKLRLSFKEIPLLAETVSKV